MIFYTLHSHSQVALNNLSNSIPGPLEYAYSALETILSFDGLYKCTI